MSIYSDKNQLSKIESILTRYLRLPFSKETIPGAIMEATLAHIRQGKVLNTYDFVDVIKPKERIGWQVKSTKEKTPVTWKRAKIPNAESLIKQSRQSDAGLQRLGDAILKFCNDHAVESMNQYDLKKIGYARLIVREDKSVTYFEKTLCSTQNPKIFDPNEFLWKWSIPKKTMKKEQLPALHGIHKPTERKWWAWHGLGENQLHFSGEGAWWSSSKSRNHAFTFSMPTDTDRLSFDEFLELLKRFDTVS